MKERITVTIDKDLLKWLDKKIKFKIFANRSHGLEFLIKNKMMKRTETQRVSGAQKSRAFLAEGKE